MQSKWNKVNQYVAHKIPTKADLHEEKNANENPHTCIISNTFTGKLYTCCITHQTCELKKSCYTLWHFPI